jgi:hypothetical protein
MLHFVIDRKEALKMVFRLMRVDVCDARELCNDFVHTWVVFHCAGAERIESGIDSKIPL